MICDNCRRDCLVSIGFDELDNEIFECKDCGSICYEDGTLVEDEIKLYD